MASFRILGGAMPPPGAPLDPPLLHSRCNQYFLTHNQLHKCSSTCYQLQDTRCIRYLRGECHKWARRQIECLIPVKGLLVVLQRYTQRHTE